MAFESGFFNSIKNANGEYDRLYDARQMSSLFDGIILDGVFQSVGNGMLVKAATGTTVTVSTGRAWFDNTWSSIDAAMPVSLPASHSILNRYDAIVLEVNHSPSVRKNEIKVVVGNPASDPKRPNMVKSALVNQYPLAYIFRGEGTTTISQGAIINVIGTKECPFVIGVNKSLTADQLLAQWTAQWEQIKKDETAAMNQWMTTSEQAFTVWFSELQDQMDQGEAAGIINTLKAHDIRIKTLEGKLPTLNRLNDFAVESNVKRRIYVQLTEPKEAKDGDIWFKA